MKTNAKREAVVMALASAWLTAVHVALGLTPFQEACHNGAPAQVAFRVLDDYACPVQGAKVNVFFDMEDRSKGRRIFGTTDTNGLFVAEAKTMGVLEVEVSREGYYRSRVTVSFIDMGREHEVRQGKWQPWGMPKDVILLPKKNPCAVKKEPLWRDTKELNKWIGFDLAEYDFVKPYGKGAETDIEVMFDWDGIWDPKDYTGMALKIKFPLKFSGGYYADKTQGSEYPGVYHANTNGEYKNEFIFFERIGSRDKRGRVKSWERHLFDSSKVLVIRSRCELNDDGTLKSARYFQLGSIRFAGDERGAALKFLSIYNPTPNDTNLEPK